MFKIPNIEFAEGMKSEIKEHIPIFNLKKIIKEEKGMVFEDQETGELVYKYNKSIIRVEENGNSFIVKDFDRDSDGYKIRDSRRYVRIS